MQRVVLALLLLATAVFAQNPSAAQLALNDQHVLQYALLLERLESAFYNQYQAQFTADNFTAAGLTATDYAYFNLIRAHEQAHVDFLTPLVPNPGNCTYNFGVTNVSTYIQVAALLENTGVSAYAGALKSIYTKGTQTAAATIATVEARHASFLNRVNARVPFPDAYDTAATPDSIATAVFTGPNAIATCQFSPSFAVPVVYTVQPIANSSDAAQPTPSTLLANDVLVLQYALFLEHLEAAFYTYVVANFGSQLDPQTGIYFNLIQQHETSHVNALNSTIFGLGSTAGPACISYNFTSLTSVASVLATAALLENTGVYAYNGAVSAINDNGLKEVAATIVTVEARHASYLNALTNNSQTPVNGGAQGGAYDNAFDFNTIVNAVIGSGLLGDCSNALPFVQPFSVLVVKPYNTVAPTNAPTNSPATTASTPTVSPATTAAGTTAGATTAGSPTVAPTVRPTTRPISTTSDATVASVSVAAALLVAMAAL